MPNPTIISMSSSYASVAAYAWQAKSSSYASVAYQARGLTFTPLLAVSASFATRALSASYAPQQTVAIGTLPIGSTQLITSSVALSAVTASWSDTSLYADTSLWSVNAVNSEGATSASFASFASVAQLAQSATNAVNANHALTAGVATTAGSSNFSNVAVSSSYASVAQTAVSSNNANYATSASVANYANSAGAAQSANSANIAVTATNANYAISAQSASIAQIAVSSNNANYATAAGISANATSASFAQRAISASVAGYANNAGTAASAQYAISAGSAISASYAPNAGGTSLVPGATYPITASYAITALNAFSASSDNYVSFLPDRVTTKAIIGFTAPTSNEFVIQQQNASIGGISLRTSGSQRIYLDTGGNIQFTGSVKGIASSSYAGTASYAMNAGSGTSLVPGNSYPITASWAQYATFATAISSSTAGYISFLPDSVTTKAVIGFLAPTSNDLVIAQQNNGLGGISLRTSGSQRIYIDTLGNIHLSGSVKVQGTLSASYANMARTASYAMNGGTGGSLTPGATYPITSSWSMNSISSVAQISSSNMRINSTGVYLLSNFNQWYKLSVWTDVVGGSPTLKLDGPY
jgi:hypothetical protein